MSEPFDDQQGAGPARSLCDILDVVRERDLPDLLRYRPGGAASFHALSAARFLADIERCAAGLRTLGVSTGDRVGLICAQPPRVARHPTSAVIAWELSWCRSSTRLTAAQLRYCFGNSGCTVVVVEAAEQADKLGDALASEELGDVRWVVTIGESYPERREGPELDEAPRTRRGSMPRSRRPSRSTRPPRRGRRASATGSASPLFSTWPTVQDRRRKTRRQAGRCAVSRRRAATISPPSSTTSGTTGPPKGVMLSHANILANIEGVQRRVPTFPGDVGMSVLPLCHVYERMIDYNYLMAGARVVYSSPAEAGADMRQVQPTILIGVPRLFGKDPPGDRISGCPGEPDETCAVRLGAALRPAVRTPTLGKARGIRRHGRRELGRPVSAFLASAGRTARPVESSRRARRPPALDLRWRSGAAGVGQLVVPLLRVEPRAGLRSYGKLAGDLRQCRRHEPRGQRWRALGQCRGAHCRGRRGSQPAGPM